MSTSKRSKISPQKIGNQLDLIDIWEDIMEPGGMDITTVLAGVVSKSIGRSKMSRWDIAAKVSELVGREVSKSMLDAYTAESKEAHRLPTEIVPALCFVLNDFSILKLLGRTCGCNVLEYDEAIFAEIAKKERQIRKLVDEKERMQTAALRYNYRGKK